MRVSSTFEKAGSAPFPTPRAWLLLLLPLMVGLAGFQLYRAGHALGSLTVTCAAVTILSWLMNWINIRINILARLLTGALGTLSAAWLSEAGVIVWPDFGSPQPGHVKAGYAIGSILLYIAAACFACVVLAYYQNHGILMGGVRVWAMLAAYIATGVGAAIESFPLALVSGILAVVATLFVTATADPLVSL